MIKNRLSYRVNFADCDPARIVYYPKFFEWFDRGAEMLFRVVGLDWEKMYDQPEFDMLSGTPIVDAGAKFLSPARFGDTIEVESWIEKWGNSSFTLQHRIHNGERLAVEGYEVRVWMVRDSNSASGIRAIPVPEHVKARFEAES